MAAAAQPAAVDGVELPRPLSRADAAKKNDVALMAARKQVASLAKAKARGRLGLYFPTSMAFTVWRETFRRSPSSFWLHPMDVRRSRTEFFTGTTFPHSTLQGDRKSQ